MIFFRFKLSFDRKQFDACLSYTRRQVMSMMGVLVLALLGTGCSSDSTESPAIGKQARVEAGSVQLVVNFPESENFSATVPCFEDSTVFSILEDAQQSGLLKFKSRGSGETAFLESIQGLENSGSGGGNWVYRVNDQLGDKSSGVFPVTPDDKILWSYGKVKFDENKSESKVDSKKSSDEDEANKSGQ